MLNKNQFKNPPANFAPGYFWSINSKIDVPLMISQLKEMAAKGARSVCMHPMPREFRWETNMAPSYLSPEYHALMKQVVDAADKLGMHWYLYDEGGWPSGSACGQVWAKDPERFSRTYAEIVDGKVRISKVNSDPKRNAPVPDVLVPGVTDLFIKLTHKAYAKYMKPYFGKSVMFAFTDEPTVSTCHPGRLGWTADLPQEFLRRKGYDLMPHVADLIQESLLPCKEISKVALDYRDVMADLFVERYLIPIRDWCRKNGLRSGGHFGGEDQWFDYDLLGFGNILQSLHALDFPGVDMIWHQLYPGERMHPFPKLASSAAHQTGASQVLGELFAIYGKGQMPDVQKYLMDWMYFCGVNTFVFSSISMTMRDGGMQGLSFGPINPIWEYTGEYHNYAARMSALMAQGKSQADTALFLDLRAFLLFNRTREYAICRSLKCADTLMEAQCDFDYIDDRLLVSAQLQKGKLVVGKMKYSRLVMPGQCILSTEGERKLAELKKAGFPVYDGEEPEALAPLIRLDHAEKGLRVTKRALGNGEYGYFIFNTSKREVTVKITLEETAPVSMADPATGEWYAVKSSKGSFQWTFRPWESHYFLSSNRIKGKTMPPRPGQVLRKLDGNWKLKPLWKRFPGLHEYETATFNEAPKPVKLGDWRPVLGDYFSGEALYSLDFVCDSPEKVTFLDLGKVNYAVQVKLNGRNLGRRIFSPFVFPIKGLLKKGRNHLEIIVVNTMANATGDPEVRKYWKENFRTSVYTSIMRPFESEALPSGLFGPVVLR